MAAIMICLGKEDRDAAADVLKLLNILLSTDTDPEDKCQILKEEFQIEMTQTLEGEVSLMCNLSKGIEEKGIEKGIEMGRIYGAISAYKDLGFSEEMILEKLQEKFHLTKEAAKKCLNETK